MEEKIIEFKLTGFRAKLLIGFIMLMVTVGLTLTAAAVIMLITKAIS